MYVLFFIVTALTEPVRLWWFTIMFLSWFFWVFVPSWIDFIILLDGWIFAFMPQSSILNSGWIYLEQNLLLLCVLIVYERILMLLWVISVFIFACASSVPKIIWGRFSMIHVGFSLGFISFLSMGVFTVHSSLSKIMAPHANFFAIFL